MATSKLITKNLYRRRHALEEEIRKNKAEVAKLKAQRNPSAVAKEKPEPLPEQAVEVKIGPTLGSNFLRYLRDGTMRRKI